MEGQRPILDEKALPFHTKEYLHAMELNKQGGYEHPVFTYYDSETMSYHTILYRDRIHILDWKEAEYYMEAAKKDPNIHVFQAKGKEFLYQDWNKAPFPSEQEIEKAFQNIIRNVNRETDQMPPEDVLAMKNGQKQSDLGEKEEQWDLSGSVLECIKRYSNKLSEAQINEIIQGMEQGLDEEQIKAYFKFSATKMKQYRRAYILVNGGKNSTNLA